MAKIIKQITINGTTESLIFDDSGWSENLNETDIIYSLTIYSLPGTIFRINNASSSFIMNNSGIFQLDLEKPISSLQIDWDSYNLIVNNNHTCIIDYYTEEAVTNE